MANGFEKGFESYCRDKGWTVIRSGWPDFLVVHDGEIRAYELKSESDVLRPNQKEALAALIQAGIDVCVLFLDADCEKAKNYRRWIFEQHEGLLEWKLPRYAWINHRKYAPDFDGLGVA